MMPLGRRREKKSLVGGLAACPRAERAERTPPGVKLVDFLLEVKSRAEGSPEPRPPKLEGLSP